MPLFEYTCTACESDFELLIRNSETPACPECHSSRLEKRFSIPAAHSGTRSSPNDLPLSGGPCGMGGCGRPECEI